MGVRVIQAESSLVPIPYSCDAYSAMQELYNIEICLMIPILVELIPGYDLEFAGGWGGQ
jgi:hypothetical protein